MTKILDWNNKIYFKKDVERFDYRMGIFPTKQGDSPVFRGVNAYFANGRLADLNAEEFRNAVSADFANRGYKLDPVEDLNSDMRVRYDGDGEPVPELGEWTADYRELRFDNEEDCKCFASIRDLRRAECFSHADCCLLS